MRLTYTFLLIFYLSIDGFSQKYLLKEDVNKDTVIPKFGFRRKFDFSNYMAYGIPLGSNLKVPPSDIYYLKSMQFREGFWFRAKLTKWYAIGTLLEYNRNEYRLKNPIISDSLPNSKTLWTRQINNQIAIGVFNRFSFKKDKILIDLGAYYAYDVLPRIITKVKPNSADYGYKKITYNQPKIMNRQNYGLDFRFTYGLLGCYTRYRISGLYKDESYDLPKITTGIVIDLKN